MPQPPWYTHMTLDTLAHVLNNSLLHPYIALLIPLCLRACAKPYSAPSMQLSFLWAGLVILGRVLGALNRRLADGPSRELDWEEEVVVITGGRSGLGRCLAEMYGMRGASVAVLDLEGGKEGMEGNEALAGVKFYACDVSRVEDVLQAKEKIEAEVGTFPPSTLNPTPHTRNQ